MHAPSLPTTDYYLVLQLLMLVCLLIGLQQAGFFIINPKSYYDLSTFLNFAKSITFFTMASAVASLCMDAKFYNGSSVRLSVTLLSHEIQLVES